MKSIAFLAQLPKNVSPGQRFRFEQYENLLIGAGFRVDTFPFLDKKVRKILYQKGHLFQKVTGVINGFVKRIRFLGVCKRYDYIFVQREMTPIGPPFFEWMVARVFRCKIIYDFDDAIWIPNVSEGNQVAQFLKCFWKVKYISKWAYKVSVGNQFLGAFAKQFNKQVIYNPTCVDTQSRYNILANHDQSTVTIGWTGSHSTLQFLELCIPALKKLEQKHQFRFLVICDQKPDFDLASMTFIPWNAATEIEDLARINIGIMPLKHDAWSEGKCGFKIIQYLALGIPAVASPVGVNKQIIEHGNNGFLCETDSDWVECLSELLTDIDKRKAFGKKGRQKIEKAYSVHANADNFLSLFS